MDENKLDFGFSFDLSTVDRAACIEGAAHVADAQRAHLSGSTEGVGPEDAPVVAETPEGKLLRELGKDRIDLGYPDVYRITDRDFLDQKRPVPVRLGELTRDFDFYWMRFPLSLFPAPSFKFDRLEVGVAMTAGGGAEMQPKAYEILPRKEWKKILEGKTELEVTIDESFAIAAKAAGDAGVASASGKVSVEGAAAAKIVAGPFLYRVRKVTVDHSATGTSRVFWRFDGDEPLEEGPPDIVVIAQIPRKAAAPLRVSVAAQASRYFAYWSADIKEVVAHLGERIASFWKSGAPVQATADFDLGPRLGR